MGKSSRRTLAAAGRGGVNLHASLLPKYRGAAPINWAIYHGETETGVTVITSPANRGRAVRTLSCGAIDPDETGRSCRPDGRSWRRLVCETIDLLESGHGPHCRKTRPLASEAPG